MGVLVYYSVPLYQLFCQVTGYGGTTQESRAAPAAAIDQEITIRFDANVMPGLPWAFVAPEPVKVRLGEQREVAYKGKNVGTEPTLGTATFNVVPLQTSSYFNKVECFCFTEQLLLPGEGKEFAVSFFVDPALLQDSDTNNVSTITLSYTFFNQGAEARDRYMREHKISFGPTTATGSASSEAAMRPN